jgi:hypothetical protein
MATKQCSACGESADEAKAFCPGCGHSFDEEAERHTSDFQNMDSTVQVGKTMYGQMLSDMGLNIGQVRNAPAEEPNPISSQPGSPSRTANSADRVGKNAPIGFVTVVIGLVLLILAAALVLYLLPRTT